MGTSTREMGAFQGGVVFVISLLTGSSTSLSCTSELQTLDCLPVFTHSPSSLTKCYCTSRCPSLETLRNSCQSGQLQIDPCGICLQCAPGYGEKCGGFGNADGVPSCIYWRFNSREPWTQKMNKLQILHSFAKHLLICVNIGALSKKNKS